RGTQAQRDCRAPELGGDPRAGNVKPSPQNPARLYRPQNSTGRPEGMNAPWHCIDAFLDGELTPALEAELRDWLIADRDHLRVFVRETPLPRSVRTELLARQLVESESALTGMAGRTFEG